jgi:hypothetical protein
VDHLIVPELFEKVIAKAHRAQADALEIEAAAKRRLADEYDAAQERGELQRRGGDGTSKVEVPTASEIGLTHKDIHEARLIRDAEEAQLGSVHPLPQIICVIPSLLPRSTASH